MNNDSNRLKRGARGFSFFEVALILVVAGLIAAAILPKLIKQIQGEAMKGGKGVVRTLREEIIGYAIENCALPPQNAPQTLGHRVGQWKGSIAYRPAPELTQAGLTAGDFSIGNASSSLRVDAVADQIAFVLADGGENHSFEDLASIVGANPVPIRSYGEDVGGRSYDDLVDFVTLDYLRQVTRGYCEVEPEEREPKVVKPDYFIYDPFNDKSHWTTDHPGAIKISNDWEENDSCFLYGIRQDKVEWVWIPVPGTLRDVWGFGPDDVYVVGDGTTIMHYDGTTWNDVPWRDKPRWPGINFYGVWGSAPDNVWAVAQKGHDRRPSYIWHFNGRYWERVKKLDTWLRAVWGSGPNDIFAVTGGLLSSQGDGILHYDGNDWSYMPSSPKDVKLLDIHGTGPDNVIAVGAWGKIYRYNGHSWRREDSDANAYLRGVWSSAPDDSYAVGDLDVRGSAVTHYDGTSWDLMRSHSLLPLRGCWASSWSNVFATAGVGVFQNYNGYRWCDVDTYSGTIFRGIWGWTRSDIFAVGGDIGLIGYIGHYKNMGGYVIRLDHVAEMRDSWQVGNLLSYDLQAKIGWYYRLDHGMSGINFRWHKDPVNNRKYQGYGVSLMLYSRYCDILEHTAKPRETRDSSDFDLRDKHLIVLWRKTIDEYGRENKVWLAYKDVSNDENIKHFHWWEDIFDGQFHDLTSLVVRVVEEVDGGEKHNKVQVFYGSKEDSHDSTGNPIDIKRKAYLHSDEDENNIIFPPTNLSDWNKDNDYFTLVVWDGINPNETDDVSLDKDEYDNDTLILKRFTSPNAGEEFPDDRREVALHAFGDIRKGEEGSILRRWLTVAFDDFAAYIH